MESALIWCIDGDKTAREAEVYLLLQTGFSVKGFENCDFTEEKEIPDLIIAEVEDKNGKNIIERLKKDLRLKDVPVIIASEKGEEKDKIAGFDMGAEDYIVKPLSMTETVLRVKAVLRRCKREEILSIGKIKLNVRAHTVQADGKSAELSLKEFELLEFFLKNAEKVLSRDCILTSVWGEDYFGELRTVDIHIKTLRQKLGDSGKCIKTVIGIGYKLSDKE